MKKRIDCLCLWWKMPKHLLCLSLLLFTTGLIRTGRILAQNQNIIQQSKKIVRGRVTNEKGEPLQSASVQVKGTSIGTVTNANGEYQLNIIVSKATVLIFSFVGMEQKEFTLGEKSMLNVILSQVDNLQQDVVVVGYGTQKKQAVTGAVSTANLKTYENVQENNILESVKGTIAGLNVGGINTAGQLATISIRGQNSINAGSSPLIVVDGAIFAGTLNDIAPGDIESFTVLKDASAAAVYGSRSANGVILIETKKGSSIKGKPKFNINISNGTSSELKHLNVYDGPGYIKRLLDIRQANNLDHDSSKIALYLQNQEAINYNATPNHTPTLTDPYGLFRETGQSLNTTVSVSNRTDKTSYYLSGNLINQKGVIDNDLYKHYSARVNIETDLTNWFKIGVKGYYSLKSYPGATIYGTSGGGSSSSPYWFSPYASVYNPDGSYMQFPQTTTSFNSPFWQIPNQIYNRQSNLNGILTAVVKIPWVKGLTYNLTYSNTLNSTETGDFYGLKTIIGAPINGSGDEAYSRSYTVLLDHLLKYYRTFGKNMVDVSMLYSTENYTLVGMSTHASGFNDPSLGYFGLSNGQIQTVSTSGTQTAAIGEMARVTYGYDNRYTLTGTVRMDGYSAFSANNKYGTFPSIGGNWNINEERFMKSVKSINRLALRASYGTNGNQSIPAYGTLAHMGNNRYFYYGNSSYTYTQYVSTLGNDNLKWESTTGLNLGLDFSILKNRIKGSVDWYSKYTHNLIFPVALPSTSGFSSISSNLGKVGNKGIELNLSTVNINKGAFKWRSDYSFYLNRNKIIHIYGPDSTGHEADLISQGYFIGKSIGTIYDYKVTGMWQVADSANGTIMKGMRPGTYKLLDVNKDGAISSTQDKVFLGTTKENFRWSFTNTFEYKDFTLMLYIYSVWGGHGYYQTGSNTPYNDGYAGTAYMNHIVYDYWTPSNPNAMFPRPNYTSVAPYRGVKYFDRSFIKLQKVSLSYNLTKFVKKYSIDRLTGFASADNLLTYAPHWVGLDPETGNGLTDTSIPSIRTVMIGLNLSF